MIVTDLSTSFHPCPKPRRNMAEKEPKKRQKDKEEFCIMPKKYFI